MAGGLLSIVTVSDSFVYLTFQRRALMDPQYFPLLFVGSAWSTSCWPCRQVVCRRPDRPPDALSGRSRSIRGRLSAVPALRAGRP